MIDYTLFIEEVKKANIILGGKVTEKQAHLWYEQLSSQTFQNTDFHNAMRDLTNTGNLTYPALFQKLNHYASGRREQEATDRNLQERKDAYELFEKDQQFVAAGMCDVDLDVLRIDLIAGKLPAHCRKCPCTHCPVVANMSLKIIKERLAKVKMLTLVGEE
jgi:hypothetical protein